MKQRVAVLGLGIVGSRVRENLLEAGYEVTCWSRTFRDLDGEKSSAGEALADADLVSIYLKDVPMVREVFAQAKNSLKPGTLVINHSTIDLPTTLWLAEQCAAKACDFLDAPFTGSKEAAAAGQLLYYTGGDEELIGKVSDFLSVTSKGRVHCGEIGAATVTKLATNLISACTVQAMSEALVIAKKHGVDPEVFTKAAIQNGSGSPLMAMKYPTMLNGDFDPHFTMANMWKDSCYALALGESAGVKLPAISAVSTRMEQMCGNGAADLDFSALVKAYED
ncbi:NAD(P)-dependent oxidoreductase [Luteolibacter algae]|uniref:NAD(P)-dependent oxidoreductase n=1 Tax=Luteolibacter algae TaxID=454151 RepID=A0ABW5D5N0_9BACT